MGGGDNPVFYDKNGTRWLKTKIIVLFTLAFCAVLAYWAIPQTISYKQAHAVPITSTIPAANEAVPTSNKPTVDELASLLSARNTPIIGKGSLVRVVKVISNAGQRNIVDPFTGKIIRPLSPDEIIYVGQDSYAIERYGYTGNSKRIALTFDDGPHPIYTPQLLDILSRESAEATFFVLGSNVTKYPEITQRIAREGHTLGNHTFSHSEFEFSSTFKNEQEINQSDRLISAVTGYTTSFFRIPYGGHTDQSIRNTITAVMTAQKMGYTVASYDFDSNDWKFTTGYEQKYPTLDGEDKIVLVHDNGGDRTATIAYVEKLISLAKAQGYTFVNLADMYPEAAPVVAPSEPSIIDKAVLMTAKAALVWPHKAITSLFAISITSIILTTFVNIILAIRQRKKSKRQCAKYTGDYNPLVSIIVPAYNESMVLTRAVYSLLDSAYKNIEVLIVDDGSTDDTWDIARMFDAQNDNVIAIRQVNGGKSSALNNAISRANGEIMICVDADTIFPPQTVGKFVRHFQDPTVGAVAGVVKVGNVEGIVTKWQALEYTLSIAIERNAQAYLGSIMIIPGACGAWRKAAVIEAGGYSHSTLAEDCDLTLKVQRLGHYKILQDNEALSYTEAPQKIKSLIKQRFRWTFGCIQALWKHHDMMFERDHGWLGSFVMPNAVIAIVIPLFFWPVLMIVSFQNILAGNYLIILLYFVISLALQFVIATIGLLMMRERLSYLAIVPFARFIYGPIRAYVLYNTVLTALRGSYVGWNKLVRTGSASYLQKDKAASARSS